MATGTKRINYNDELSTWKGFIDWLREQKEESQVKDCMMFEIKHQNRPQFIDRARTRYNKLRAFRELKELEKLSNKTISINCL